MSPSSPIALVSSTHIIVGWAIGGTVYAPWAMPMYLMKGIAAVAPTCTPCIVPWGMSGNCFSIRLCRGPSRILYLYPLVWVERWSLPLLGAHPNVAAHHRVDVLGDDVKVLGQVSDEYIHHLPTKARHAQRHAGAGGGGATGTHVRKSCQGSAPSHTWLAAIGGAKPPGGGGSTGGNRPPAVSLLLRGEGHRVHMVLCRAARCGSLGFVIPGH